jgi:hypothetical protein
LHGQADYRARLFLEQGCDCGAIYAAGHGDGYQAGGDFVADWEGVELGFGGHSGIMLISIVAEWQNLCCGSRLLKWGAAVLRPCEGR